jgi:TRAP-type uncharacterized transport system substrate-binding protein
MAPPRLPGRLRRTLATREPSTWFKTALLVLLGIVGVATAAQFGRGPDLSHVNVRFLSGSAQGNYHAIVAMAADEARRRKGRIENLPSAGSIENLSRLAAATATCDIHFALVQDGLPWPESNPFKLIGRIPYAEAFIVLGKDADQLRSVADLRGKRVGIGPVGSGTEHVARQVMAKLEGLDIKASTHPLHEQLAMLERGELDLGAMVIAPDSDLVSDAVLKRNLQILDFTGADAVANRLPSARAGVIKAGNYDPVRELPKADKRVILIDTLVIGNGCARESVTQGVISALVREFPDFVRFNRERPNLTGLEYASAAKSYIDADGPDLVGEHVPWVIDIMPMARWVQLVFAFSMLFAAQALWHRFRLWRLDAKRVDIEGEVAKLFPPEITVAEIGTMTPGEANLGTADRERLDEVISDLVELAQRVRVQSLSMLVPMGQEMAYRYQEQIIADLLNDLRMFRARLDD